MRMIIKSHSIFTEINLQLSLPPAPDSHQISRILFSEQAMAVNATEVFKNNAQIFNEKTKDYLKIYDSCESLLI